MKVFLDGVDITDLCKECKINGLNDIYKIVYINSDNKSYDLEHLRTGIVVPGISRDIIQVIEDNNE